MCAGSNDKEVALNRIDADIACTPLGKSNGTIFFETNHLSFIFLVYPCFHTWHTAGGQYDLCYFYWISLCDFKVSLVTSQWHFEKGN